MEQQSKKWYVVRAISGKEKKAKEYIEGEMVKRGWQDIVPQVLVPTEKVYTIKNGKKVLKERNFFPGYVLVEAVMSKEVASVIQNLPDVLDFLRDSEGNPGPMRQSEIKRIMGSMDDQIDAAGGIIEKFIIGEPVKVIDGPFNSFSGVVEEVNEDKKKLKVTVKIFGRKTPLELGFNQVEKE
ncbi:MAG: transcriptional antiterminator NusG [bacterium P3]|nr:MAG: transcriptional antiterminator NusG [bacterium P3]KWW40992.1 MAG: transcriptional antiterminator NusG [bacterium F083]